MMGAADNVVQRACLVSTKQDTGGASLAMLRLSDALRRSGMQVDVVSAKPIGEDDQDDLDEQLPEGDPFLKFLKFSRGATVAHRTDFSASPFTVHWPDCEIELDGAIQDAEVVNIHWVSHFLSPRSIRKIGQLGKPILWTMHDQRAFTGGCHYSGGCRGFESTCKDCPQVSGTYQKIAEYQLEDSKRMLRDLPVFFISPSQWLADELRSSSFFNEGCHKVKVIPNSVDTDTFSPVADRAAIRAKYDIRDSDVCVLLLAHKTSDPRKGFDDIRRALQRVVVKLPGGQSRRLRVICCGASDFEVPNVELLHLGSVPSLELPAIMGACDVYLTMTLEDNLPNTVVESLSCGLPVIGTNVGGVPEMVKHGTNGWIVSAGDSEAVSKILTDLVGDKSILKRLSIASREFALQEFSMKKQAEAYKEAMIESRLAWESWKGCEDLTKLAGREGITDILLRHAVEKYREKTEVNRELKAKVDGLREKLREFRKRAEEPLTAKLYRRAFKEKGGPKSEGLNED
ncbi:MAG: hypothetical protein CMO55_20250 [Verrucomicrobiales bacterium]|nr:hypothetical protein [Verrucomicrobiales bacterium]